MPPTSDPTAAERDARSAEGADGPTEVAGCERPATRQDPTVLETVTTTVGGMVIGSAALWFLAPICLTC